MQKSRVLLLTGLLALLLSACSQPSQPAPEPTSAPAEPTAASQGNGAYPAPQVNPAYPGPTAVPTDGPLVIPQPSSDQVGVVSGVLMRVAEDGSREPITRGELYLGTLLSSDSGVEAMVGVDKLNAPHTPLNSRGEFVFVDVPAGRYGLMYDNLEGMLLLHDPATSGDLIVEVVGGQVRELGELSYPLPPEG